MPLVNMDFFRFAVIGDVHSNALLLRRACNQSMNMSLVIPS